MLVVLDNLGDDMTNDLQVVKALQKNGMEAESLNSSTDLVERLKALLPRDCIVASGSSQTLTEAGVRQFLMENSYVYYDGGSVGLAPEERERLIRQGFGADVYLTSAAAVTEEGELLFVDGTGNRTAAISYGPKQVLVIVGKQKIVNDMDAAYRRLETVAAPKNALRRRKGDLLCGRTGQCHHCKHPQRMCCYFLRVGFSRIPGRIRVLIVGEELGY